MPANLIKFDKEKDLMRPMVRGLQQIRQGLEELRHWSAAMVQSADNNDTSNAANFTLAVSEGGYQQAGYASANAAAKASYDEVSSLLGKLDTDASVNTVRTAIFQACAKHGI